MAMIYIFAFLAGLAGAAIGWAATAFTALTLSSYLGASDFEGAAAMTAFFGFGPVGGLAGLVAGIWLTLRYGSGQSAFGAIAKRGAIVLGAIVLLAVGVFGYLSTFDEVVERNGPTPLAEFEIRLPATAPLPTRETVRIRLDTDKNQTDASLHTDWLHRDGDRAVLVGSVPLYFNTARRMLVLKSPGKPDYLFALKLPSDPPGARGMGPWQKVDFVAEPQGQPRKPQASEDYEIRYRVQRID
jgi:MFS family permease